jgi:hypothetical protein
MPSENSSTFFGLNSVQDWRKKSGITCTFVLFAALNVAMVWVGADAVGHCPVEKMVPTYLIGKAAFTRAFSWCKICSCDLEEGFFFLLLFLTFYGCVYMYFNIRIEIRMRV